MSTCQTCVLSVLVYCLQWDFHGLHVDEAIKKLDQSINAAKILPGASRSLQYMLPCSCFVSRVGLKCE